LIPTLACNRHAAANKTPAQAQVYVQAVTGTTIGVDALSKIGLLATVQMFAGMVRSQDIQNGISKKLIKLAYPDIGSKIFPCPSSNGTWSGNWCCGGGPSDLSCCNNTMTGPQLKFGLVDAVASTATLVTTSITTTTATVTASSMTNKDHSTVIGLATGLSVATAGIAIVAIAMFMHRLRKEHNLETAQTANHRYMLDVQPSPKQTPYRTSGSVEYKSAKPTPAWQSVTGANLLNELSEDATTYEINSRQKHTEVP
jgi:hypothetical protein